MLKVRIQCMPSAGDKLHVRHLFEALLHSPTADVKLNTDDPNGPRDYTFTFDPGWFPPSGKTVVYFGHDPHVLGATIDVLSMLDPELHALSIQLGADPNSLERTVQDFAERISSVLPYLDSFDVCLPMITTPFVTQIWPRLQHARGGPVVPHTVPEWIYNTTLSEKRDLDLFFVGAVDLEYYPLRWQITNELLTGKLTGVKYELAPYGLPSCEEMARTWTAERADQHQHWHASMLRRAKVCAFDGSVFRYSLARFVECMASGCLVLAPLPWDAESLEFRDGETMVHITSANWRDKLLYYLAHDEERQRIAHNAQTLVTSKYTCGARAEIILRYLEGLTWPV